MLEQHHNGSFRSELLTSKMKAAINSGRTPIDVKDHRIPVRVIEYMVKGRGETETIFADELIRQQADPLSSLVAGSAATQ